MLEKEVMASVSRDNLISLSLTRASSSRRVSQPAHLLEVSQAATRLAPPDTRWKLLAVFIPDGLIWTKRLPAESMSSRTKGFFEQDQRSKVSPKGLYLLSRKIGAHAVRWSPRATAPVQPAFFRKLEAIC